MRHPQRRGSSGVRKRDVRLLKIKIRKTNLECPLELAAPGGD